MSRPDATEEAKNLRAFMMLFTFEKKRDLEKYARTVVVHRREFVDFVLACQGGAFSPMRHAVHYKHAVPAVHVPSDADLEALHANGVGRLKPDAKRAVRKIGLMMSQTTWSAGHLFYTPGFHEWHFFVFDQNDQSRFDNHWRAVGRPHLHFVNWLWPNLDARSVWLNYVERNEKPSGSLHIRDDSEVFEEDDLAAPRSRKGRG